MIVKYQVMDHRCFTRSFMRYGILALDKMNLILLLTVLTFVGQSLAQYCSTGPGIYYFIVAFTDCREYTRNLNGVLTQHTCPGGMRFNLNPLYCGCDSSDNFDCHI